MVAAVSLSSSFSSVKTVMEESLAHLKTSRVSNAFFASLGGYLFLPLTAVQATSLGFGVTALFVAAREYQFINQLEKAPLKLPQGKFDVSAFHRPELREPWLDTLKFCALSINACGGVFFLSQLGVVTPALVGCMVAGGAARFFVEGVKSYAGVKLDQTLPGKLFEQHWVGFGVALFALRLFQSSLFTQPYLNQALMFTSGFFGAALLLNTIALATHKPRMAQDLRS